MKRIVEPELMDDKTQAEAYANADFEQAHQSVIDAFNMHFPASELEGNILDLGCGPGDISFRFANRFVKSSVIAIDGSAEMIRLANKRKALNEEWQHRISFIQVIIPTTSIPFGPYSAIISNSLLHHLHQPEVLWNTIKQYSTSGTKVMIVDLFRPENEQGARQIVSLYSANEPEILQRDFYNSLLAAFTLTEIKQQLSDAGLDELKLNKISDRHLIIFGEIK